RAPYGALSLRTLILYSRTNPALLPLVTAGNPRPRGHVPVAIQSSSREQPMIKLGYKLMSEEHGPADLVRNAQHAERAGFEFTAISDHFSPWLEEQVHSPFAS